MRKETRDWFDQGKAELKTAKNCLKNGDFHACAFHAQQSFEMCLKAFFIYKKNKLPPKTHYILDLAERLKLPRNFIESARELTPVYMLARYPDVAGGPPFKLYNKEKASKLVKIAEEFLKWLENFLKK